MLSPTRFRPASVRQGVAVGEPGRVDPLSGDSREGPRLGPSLARHDDSSRCAGTAPTGSYNAAGASHQANDAAVRPWAVGPRQLLSDPRMDDVAQSQPGAPEPAAPARPEHRSRTRRKLLLASLLCVVIPLVPIPGSQHVVGGLLVEAYRQVIGYPVVGGLIRLGWQAEIDHKYAQAERDYTLALT